MELILLFRMLFTIYSFLSLLFCLLALLTFRNLSFLKDDFKTLYNLLSLFLNFKETACVKISLFKCIFFKSTILNSIFLLYILYTKDLSLSKNIFLNLFLLNLSLNKFLCRFFL